MLSLFLLSCSKEAVVLQNSWLYTSSTLKKASKFRVRRGEIVKYYDCNKIACKVIYSGKFEGFLPRNKLYLKELPVVTVVKDTYLYENHDLFSKKLNSIEEGVRVFLLKEHKVWALVDDSKKKAWILKDTLYKGFGPYKVSYEKDALFLQFNGKWYIPSMSYERKYSLDKAFDHKSSTFSVVDKGEQITVSIKNFKDKNQNYELSYSLIKKTGYKSLHYPKTIQIIEPEQKTFELAKNFKYQFSSDKLVFRIGKESKAKNWIYLNGFSIKSVEKQ